MGGTPVNSLTHVLHTNNADDILDDNLDITDSLYYDYNQFHRLLQPNKNNFSILSSNIQSLHAKFNELEAFVTDLQSNEFEFSIICLQESWLSEHDDTSILRLGNYQCSSQGKSSSSKGGLTIYVNNNFSYKTSEISKRNANWEAQIIHISGGGLPNEIIICNVYRPPRDLNSDYRKFIDEFSEFLEEIENKNEIIIIGDFNINLLKINERELFCEFFDNLIAQGFLPKITFPTRFTRTNGTLIDNIFCKGTRSNTNIKSGILINTFSDHQPYFTILPAIQPIVRTCKQTQRYQINESTLHNVDIALQKSQIITQMELNLLSDPNINYNIMENEITNANRKYITKKTVRFNKYKHKKSEWITRGILKSIKHRDALYKELRHTNPYLSTYNGLLRNLKTFNSILKRSIRFAKKSYYAYQFNIKNIM